MTAVLRILIGLVLLTTGAAKLADVAGFARVVGTYELLPGGLTVPAAWALLIVELGLGLWLLSGRRLMAAAASAALLHLLYAAWTGLALARGLTLANCGCFGTLWARPLGWSTLAEDIILLALCLLLLARLRAAKNVAETVQSAGVRR